MKVKKSHGHKSRVIQIGIIAALILFATTLPVWGAWVDSAWTYRKQITIAAGMAPTDQTNFPVLIFSTGDTDLAANAQLDGDDIRFTLSDGITPLDHEIEEYDNTSSSEKLVAWVRIPTLAAAGMTIYMYYGNGTVGSQEDIPGTWDEGGANTYKGVWHMREDPTVSSDCDGGAGTKEVCDSTLNNNDGDANGSMSGPAAGQVDGSLNFDGSDDYVSVGNPASLNISGPTTIEAWINLNVPQGTMDTYARVFNKWKGSSGGYGLFFGSTNTTITMQTANGSTDAIARTYTFTPDNWYYVVGTWSPSPGAKAIYINGLVENSGSSSNTTINIVSQDVQFAGAATANSLNGRIDEARVSSVARSADWIKTSYNNQLPTGSYFTFGSQETITTTIGDGTTPANKTVAKGSANNAVDAFSLSTDSGTDSLTSLTVTLTGNQADVAANGVKLWEDNGSRADEWDSSDTQIGVGESFSGGTATFDLSGSPIAIDSTSTQYLITYDIVAGASSGNALQGEVTAAAVTNTLVESDDNDATLTIGAPSTVTKTIGAAARDFATMQAWETAREGVLTTRQIFNVTGGAGTFQDGEVVIGLDSGCAGTYIPQDDAVTNGAVMTLDSVSAVSCTPGEILTGGTSGATATFNSVAYTEGTIEKGEMYNDSTFTGSLIIDGSTTDANHYVWLTVAAGQRHDGTAGTGTQIDPTALDHVINIADDYTRVEWLEITGWPNQSGSNSWEGIHVAADNTLLQYLFIHDDDSGGFGNPNSDAVNLNAMVAGQTVTVRNCIIHNIGRGGVLRQNGSGVTITVNIENCTVYRTGISGSDADGDSGIRIEGSGTLNVINTISMNANSDFDANIYTAGSYGNSSNNISSDGTAPGVGSLLNRTATDINNPGAGDWIVFTNLTPTLEDLHLKNVVENDAVDVGANLSGTFTDDIDGDTRSAPWDIGADEAGAAITIIISGTCKQVDQTTDCTNTGTVRVAVNGILQSETQPTVAGIWTISNILPPAMGDVVTVFIDGAAGANEAVAVTKYDGTGNISGVELIEEHLTIGSDDNQTLTNADLAQYDNSVSADEDVFHDVDVGNNLTVDTTGDLTQDELYIKTGNTYRPESGSSGNVNTHDLEINGMLIADGNTIVMDGTGTPLVVSGTFTANTSTVQYTGTSLATNIAAVAYHHLQLTPTAATTYSLTGNLTAGNAMTGNLIVDSNAILDATVANNYNLIAVNVFLNGAYTAQGSTITASGDWTNTGSFTASTSTVMLNGTGQTVTGNTFFYNLNKTIAAADTLTFAAGSTTTIAAGGTLTLDGDPGELLSLRSTTVNTRWNLVLNATAVKAVDYVDVQDSDASASDSALIPILPTNSVDSSNTIAWFEILELAKRAFLSSDGSAIPDTSTLPKGTQVKYLIYINNPGVAVNDVSFRDVLDPTFLYQGVVETGTSSLKVNNSTTACALVTCTALEEATIFSDVDAMGAKTEAVDGDTVSISGTTIDVGNQNVGNSQMNVPAGSVGALLFTVEMQ